MNWLVKWGVKKWLLGVVNTAIAQYNGNVEKAREYVAAIIAKIEAVIAYLHHLDAALADGKLTEAEADDLTDRAIDLAKELTCK